MALRYRNLRRISALCSGPYHCWIDRSEGSKEFTENDGGYLLLSEAFLDDPSGSLVNRTTMLEKVKLLQQRVSEVGHRVLVLNKQAEVASSVELSNFGVLALPYWLTYSLERALPSGNMCVEPCFDHIQSFNPFPGKIDVHVAIDIPENAELVEPLQEHCVWRQTRGVAMEVFGWKLLSKFQTRSGMMRWIGLLLVKNWKSLTRKFDLVPETSKMVKFTLTVLSKQVQEQMRSLFRLHSI